MEKIKTALTDFLHKSGFEEKLDEMNYLDLWPQVAGPQVMKHASPVSLKEKKLWVEVSDNVWVYHLTMLKPRLIKDFNKVAGFKAIEEIKFMNVDFPSSRRKFEMHKGINADEENNTHISNMPVVLSIEEKEVLQKIAQNSPSHFKEHLHKLLRGSLLRQKRRRKSGAVDCYTCGFPYYREEMKGELCLLCFQKYNYWKKILRPLFYRTPWVKFEQLKAIYPSLESSIFDICQEKAKQQYYKRLKKILNRGSFRKDLKQKILIRIIQRFVMLSEKKDPTQLKKQDMINALQFFPEFNRIMDICFSEEAIE